MNANIVKMQIFHKIKSDLRGHSRSQITTFLIKNSPFLLFMLLIEETNVADHYEITKFDLFWPLLMFLWTTFCPCLWMCHTFLSIELEYVKKKVFIYRDHCKTKKNTQPSFQKKNVVLFLLDSEREHYFFRAFFHQKQFCRQVQNMAKNHNLFFQQIFLFYF